MGGTFAPISSAIGGVPTAFLTVDSFENPRSVIAMVSRSSVQCKGAATCQSYDL